jgi:hypothetical protein
MKPISRTGDEDIAAAIIAAKLQGEDAPRLSPLSKYIMSTDEIGRKLLHVEPMPGLPAVICRQCLYRGLATLRSLPCSCGSAEWMRVPLGRYLVVSDGNFPNCV